MQEEQLNTNEATEDAVVFPEDSFGTAPEQQETTASNDITQAENTPEQQEQVLPAATEETVADEAAPELTEDSVPADDANAETAEADKLAEEIHTFADFGFCAELMQGINEAGFTEPTPIQAKAMPLVSEGHDLIGQALTGSGKTAAFGLPIINKIANQPGLNFLILVPTRELATQVSGELFRLGRYTGLKTAAFTGGQSYSRQEQLLRQGINALVATPGRLIDLIESGHFENINPAHIVVDEADEMLDMGFIEDVRRIFKTFPGPRQTMLFSATMPRPVVQLAEEILNNPVNISTSTNETTNNEAIAQLFFVIEESERANAVIRLIDAEDVGKAMIFCRTKEETDSLNILLSARGYNVNCLHGDMEQAQRSRVMNAFRRGEIDILVATDVAARGLDVDDVTHVFNYHLPFDSRGYVHRIGRTGRAGKTGTAITLVTPREMRALDMIRKNVGAQIENRMVPTRTQVTEMRLKKIFRELNEIQLDVNLLNQVQTLSTNQDLTVLIAKLIAHQLTNGGDTGPEHIGIGGQRLANLLSPKPRDRRRGERGDRGDRGESADRFGRKGGRYAERRQQRAEGRFNPKLDRENRIKEEIPAPVPAENNEGSNNEYFSDFGQIEQSATQERPREERPREERKSHRERPDRSHLFERKPRRNNDFEDRPPYEENAPGWKHYDDEEPAERPRRERDFSEKKSFGKHDHADRKSFDRRERKTDFNDRKPFGKREGKSFSDERKSVGEKKSFGDRKSFGAKKNFADDRKKNFGDKKAGKSKRNLPPAPPAAPSGNWYFN